MYLKSIDVQGFKSFANKMTFEFHNGITGIVGPNGSGKSNVADAVRWVLGEQSAKQLRGGNMQDVIFSGTETRKPQGFAYVAITMDNSDHKLDVEYEEVTVARRIYRSGESEYLINGASCRLRDIQELFYDTGIGKEGYSIIGQGQIDKILSGKPEERRELFDEAAGIVKFKRRKNTAIKKLEEEKQNLVRVTDILSELTKQLGPLERQSEVARIYLKKKETLKNLDVNQYLLEMGRIKEQVGKLEESKAIASSDLQETTEEFEQVKQEYNRLEEALEALEQQIEGIRNEVSEKTLHKQSLENEVKLLQEQIHSAKDHDEHYSKRLEAIDFEKQRHNQELDEFKKKENEHNQQLAEVEGKKAEFQKNLESITEELGKQKQAILDSENGLMEVIKQRSATKGQLQRFDALMEQIGIRKASLNQRVLSLKADEARQHELFNEAKEQFEEVELSIGQLREQITSYETKEVEIQKQLSKIHNQIEVGQNDYHREHSRLESLTNLTERYDGYGNSIKKVMEQKGKVPGIKGVVADLLKVAKEYEVAIETALGGSIQNIVTEDEQTAKRMIQYLKQNKFGRATFLPISSMSSSATIQNQGILKEEGVLGLASNLVTVSNEYKNLAVSLLGRTVVVDQIDHAIAIANKYRHSVRMVTLEGELLNTGGSMTGGAFKNSSNLLGRRREIEELSAVVEKLRQELKEVTGKQETLREERSSLREELIGFKDSLQKQLLLQNTARLKKDNTKRKLEEIQKGYDILNAESGEIEQQIFEADHSNQAIRVELEASKTQQITLQKQSETLQKELNLLIEKEDQEKQHLERVRLEYATITQEIGFADQNKIRIQRELQQLEDEANQVIQNLEESQKEIEKKGIRIQQTEEALTRETKEIQEQQNLLKENLLVKEEKNKTFKSFFEKRDGLSSKMNLLDKDIFRLNNQLEKLEETKEAKTNYLWEEYELTPNRASQLRQEELQNFQENKKQILEIRDAIRKLGTVNVNSIEDYKNVLERHSFLNTQYEDLVTAQDTLLGIIEELDAGMRKQFREKFEQIRVEFDKAFKELFGGGKGTLELDEEQDLLEAGIKIISQPPGKKLQNMMQLSGGEKALTAIALLFAIQNLKPSPFCLLDEIEAALDDSNVIRYAQYLHKLTKNTQFIIITHRRGSMNAADRLYGITMQEKGVSTLVSVNLIENDLEK